MSTRSALLLASLALVTGCSAVLGLDFAESELGPDPPRVTTPSGCVAIPCNGQCGIIPDGCGGEMQCAACGVGEVCGGRGPNRCGPGTCTPKACENIAGACGRVSNGCGAVIDCPPCTVDQVPCALPWDQTLLVEDGASLQAFENGEVPFRSTCNVQTRVCTHGVLSGSFVNESCRVAGPASCDGPGGVVAHGGSTTAYASAQVAWNATCQSQTRTCDNGALSGTFAFGSCAPAPPPGFACTNPATVLATSTCGAPPPIGPFFVHRFQCASNNVLTDTVQVIPQGGGGQTTHAYTGGTQAFPISCVPGGAASWSLSCQPVGSVIRCTVNGQTFELPQL